MLLAITKIKMDAGTQTRDRIYQETVDCYADAMADGDKFPPVVVFQDDDGYYLADGFHRVTAKRKNGENVIEADVRPGDLQDAIMHSMQANYDNGLYRSNADKRACVAVAISTFPTWSDRKIAEGCRVSHPTVAKVRSSGACPSHLLVNFTTPTVQPEKVVCRNGETRVKLPRRPLPDYTVDELEFVGEAPVAVAERKPKNGAVIGGKVTDWNKVQKTWGDFMRAFAKTGLIGQHQKALDQIAEAVENRGR